MTNDRNQPRPDDPSPHEQMLNYRSAAADRQSLSKGEIIGGFLISLVLILAAVFFGILASIGPQRNTAPGNAVPFIVIVGVGVVGINLFAFLAYRNPQRRGLAIGLWIGFGVGVLIEGACFGLGR